MGTLPVTLLLLLLLQVEAEASTETRPLEGFTPRCTLHPRALHRMLASTLHGFVQRIAVCCRSMCPTHLLLPALQPPPPTCPTPCAPPPGRQGAGLPLFGRSFNAPPARPNCRIDFAFDRAAFQFEFLPFTIPYPVPFRLLGDERKVRQW